MLSSKAAIVAFTLGVLLASCATPRTSHEILIALKPDAIALLKQPQSPDPMNTGLPSLDSLNRKWHVRQMSRVFPNISPADKVAARYGLARIYKLVVQGRTDLAAMAREYQADPYVEYAEINQPYEAK